ncbi:hypothetical protein [Leptolyngbya sp. FACHB-16]|uniref:hypothetical protein n=1 Tax=unclassified Leptolyngbya TaxID=2650499 RepID=UPI0016853AA6|nr:hypothetical protein [Leptolyngbya sp. FACHB-16]MBD2157866.1 hypothetical protein [Leptolyngbya sp. FACHB-16]
MAPTPAPTVAAAAGDRSPSSAQAKPPVQGSATASEQQLLDNWLNIQSINLTRHAKSLRPFTKDEFGTGPASPSEAHIESVNRFIDKFRSNLVEMARWVDAAAAAARREPTTERLQVLLERKQKAGNRVLHAEGIWDFYFDLFVQRLSTFGERLRSVDRICANCYEDLYVGLGTAQPTPSLLPFSYASSGFSPATFRRGVPLRRLRHNPNLFPLIMLPQHRLDNVWALSSILHEVSHNLQADIGLWEEIPARVYQRLTTEGQLPADIAQIWAQWHKETMADMFALVLGGPAAVESLMDVVGRSPTSTVQFIPGAVHPTPYLRVLINLILLRRLGFDKMGADLTRVWQRLYPRISVNDIPPRFMKTFQPAAELVVDTMVFQPYRQFANKSLAQVVKFGPAQMAMIETAGRRLAAGQDPGTVPLRFMVSAARFALDKQLATPQTITDNFYRILGRR